jgi:hypothetical protein
MCCCNYNTKLMCLIAKAILEAPFREKFLADPMTTAKNFGVTNDDLALLALYDDRKLRAMVEGPPAQAESFKHAS